MFPMSDDNSDVTITPYVNYIFIGINIVVFVFACSKSAETNRFRMHFRSSRVKLQPALICKA